MICNDPAQPKLDGTPRQLYWKVRRRIINHHAFRTESGSGNGNGSGSGSGSGESGSKRMRRETNWRDAACLGGWGMEDGICDPTRNCKV
jgi:hypothetical protein